MPDTTTAVADPTPEAEPTPEPAAPPAAEPQPAPEPPAEPEQPSTELATLADAPPDLFPGFHEMQGLAAMAVTLAGAQAVPAALQNRPNDVFLVLLTARELGIAPTAALRTAYVVNGAVTLAPKLRAAMVRQRGIGRLWPDPGNDDFSATWHATRADEAHQHTYSYTFTLDGAKRVPLDQWEGSGNNRRKTQGTLADKDNWKGYPQRMLSWRALGYLLDDVFPEVGTGLYSPDELGAMTDGDGAIIDVSSTDPLAGTKAPVGHNQPPPPPLPLLVETDPEAHAELGRRIEAIKAAPEAAAALLELWTKPMDDNNTPTLPAFAQLLARQLGKAKAQVSSIEKRIQRPEWGDDAKKAWADATVRLAGFGAQDGATAAQAGAAEPSADPTPDNPPDAAEPATGPTDGVAEQPALPLTDEQLIDQAIIEVKAMALPAVAEALRARRMDPSGNPDSQRRLLAEHLFTERVVLRDRDQPATTGE